MNLNYAWNRQRFAEPNLPDVESEENAKTVISRLRFVAQFVFIGFAASIAFHYGQGHIMHRGYPWNTYLFDPADRFNDWYNPVASARMGDPYFKNHVAISNYFPFAYLALSIVSCKSHGASLLIYMTLCAALFPTGVYVLWNKTVKPQIRDRSRRWQAALLLAASLGFSYPLQFAIDRGNTDVLIAAFCLLYVALLRTRYASLGSVALAVGIASKGYPAAFCLLALADRRFKQAALPLLIAAALTVVGLLGLAGGLQHNIVGLNTAVTLWHNLYVVGHLGMSHSSDPYHALQYAAERWRLLRIDILLGLYHIFSFEFACVCAFFALFVSPRRWQQVTAVCLAAIIFPDLIADYKLLALLPGLLFIVADREAGSRGRIALFCYAALLIPKQYLFDDNGMSIGIALNAMLLILLAATVLVDPEAWSTASRLAPARLAWYLAVLPFGLEICRRLPLTEIQRKQSHEMAAL